MKKKGLEVVESPRPVSMDKLHWPHLECVRSEDSGVGTDIGVHVSCTPSSQALPQSTLTS